MVMIFVVQALEKGLLFVSSTPVLQTQILEKEIQRLLKVKDTLKALQQLATEYRDTLTIPIIAITGCNGKTTTKNFMANVLAQKICIRYIWSGKSETYLRGNLNNFIGATSFCAFY